MNEELMARLSSLEDELTALENELLNKRKLYATLADFHLEYKPYFPLSAANLGKINDNLNKLNAPISKLQKAEEITRIALAKIDAIDGFPGVFKATLATIHNLDEAKLYDSALLALIDLEKRMREEHLSTASFAPIANEIIAYQKCALLKHKCEDSIASGGFLVSKEELYAYRELALSLTTIANPESLKSLYVDEVNGLIFYLANRSVASKIPSIDTFLELKEAMALAEEEGEYLSPLTAQRAAILRETYLTQFNGLSYEYFENEPNYDKAVEIYRGRVYLSNAEIDHYAYKESEEEKQFYYAFIKSSCLKKSPSAYNDSVLVYGQKAAAGDEEAFTILAHIISLPLLDAAKFNMALRAAKTFTFVQMLHFLAETVRLGADREKATLIFDEMCKRKKEGDLEEMADSLHYLNFHIDPSIREEFNALRLSLLRSTKAHRVKIKSTNENLHLVFGEEKGTYPVPAGKKTKNNFIKAWSLGQLAIYWLFMAVIPIVAAALVTMAISNNRLYETYTRLIFIPAFIVVYAFAVISGLQWFSNDEWESSIFRRVMILVSILTAIIPTLYYISPSTFPSLKPWSLPLFIVSAATGILDMLIFRERKKVWAYVTTIPFGIIIVLCSVFLILEGAGVNL